MENEDFFKAECYHVHTPATYANAGLKTEMFKRSLHKSQQLIFIHEV